MATKKKTSRKRKAKAIGRPRGKGGANKSDFIRSLPNDMPAKAVVEAGKAKGMTFSQQLVYNVRAGARGGKKGRGPKRVRRAARSAPAESTFRQTVIELGVARARQLLDEVEARLQELIQ